GFGHSNGAERAVRNAIGGANQTFLNIGADRARWVEGLPMDIQRRRVGWQSERNAILAAGAEVGYGRWSVGNDIDECIPKRAEGKAAVRQCRILADDRHGGYLRRHELEGS